MSIRIVILATALFSVARFAGAQTPANNPEPRPGTAVVRGHIVAADTGKPLRRARVSFASPQLGGRPRTVSTSADGQYEIRELSAGRYTVSVDRSGYLTMRYGQRRPLEAARPLQIVDGQTVEHVDFALPRTGSISGQLTDEVSDSVGGALVFALRSEYWLGQRQLVPVGPPARTDDSGRFRIANIAPGNYFLRAVSRETWTVTRAGRRDVMSFLSTYYPGTPNVTAAQSIAVGVGQQARNADFQLTPGRTVTLSGTAVDSHGRPLTNVLVGQEVIGPSGGTVGMAGSGPVAADGTFTIRDVTPGQYRLMAAGSGEIAMLPMMVTADLENIALVASPGWSASGSIVTETGTPPPIQPARVRINPNTSNAFRIRMQAEPEFRSLINDDWTFSLSGIVGRAHLVVTLPDGWVVNSIFHNGRDVAESSLEVSPNETLKDLLVIISDHPSVLSGQVSNGQGAPSDGTVIVFSTNADRWVQDSRFVRAVRANEDGQFQISGLLAGEYFAAAVDYVQDGLWNDPEYLDTIRRRAQRVTVGESNSSTLALRLMTP
jgi:hypothetical protein